MSQPPNNDINKLASKLEAGFSAQCKMSMTGRDLKHIRDMTFEIYSAGAEAARLKIYEIVKTELKPKKRKIEK